MTNKLRRLFPRLLATQYQVRSRKTKRYNCLAWAAGQDDCWWQSPPDGVWPDGVLDDGSVEAAVRLFEHFGFQRTGVATLEPGFTKVAIYGDAVGYTHAAQQLPDGRWTSKIGMLQDIDHNTLDNLFTFSPPALSNQLRSVRAERAPPVPPVR